MPIEIKFTGDTVEAVYADMRRVLAGQDVYDYAAKTAGIEVSPATVAASIQKPARAKKAEKVTVQEAETCMADQGAPPEPAVASYAETEAAIDAEHEAREAAKQEAPAAEAIDYDAVVKPAVLAYANKHGREATQALLKQFGVETARELSPSSYAKLLEVMG